MEFLGFKRTYTYTPGGTIIGVMYEAVSKLSPLNVQWNRKYFEPGDFSIQIRAEEYNSETTHIFCSDRVETGIVQKVEYSDSLQGKFVQLSGYFFEKELDDRIVDGTFYSSGNIQTLIRTMIETYGNRFLYFPSIKDPGGSTITLQTSYGALGKTAYDVLKTQDYSLRALPNLNVGIISSPADLEIYKARDRTQSQSVNTWVTFSSNFGNFSDVNVVTDNSNYKNYAVVGGSGEGKDRIIVKVMGNTPTTETPALLKQVFVDARDLTYDSETQTLDEYKEALRQRGLEKLVNYQTINNITLNATDTGYEYLVDYDLGDKVDVIIEDLQLRLECRIIAIYEVFKNNQHTIELEFGNKVLSTLEKARLY